MNNKIVTNIYDLNSDCGNRNVICEGYMLYVDCIKTIIRGGETCLQFYIVDSYGNVINSNIMSNISLKFSNEYDCESDFIGLLNNDNESDVNIISLQESLQNPTFILNLEEEDFTTDINGEYKNNKLQFCTATKDIIDGINVLNVQKSSISFNTDCNYQSRMEIEYVFPADNSDSDIIENTVTYIICETPEQRTIQNINVKDIVEIYEDAKRVTLLYPNSELYIKSILLNTEKIKNKGKFQICLTAEQTASLVRGSLKINGLALTNNNENFSLGCVKIANIV